MAGSVPRFVLGVPRASSKAGTVSIENTKAPVGCIGRGSLNFLSTRAGSPAVSILSKPSFTFSISSGSA
jgi:hypothetical protein